MYNEKLIREQSRKDPYGIEERVMTEQKTLLPEWTEGVKRTLRRQGPACEDFYQGHIRDLKTHVERLLQALEAEKRKVERAKGEIKTTLNRLEHVFGGLHWLEQNHKRIPEGQSIENWIGNIRPSVTYSLDGLTEALKELEE